MDGFGAGQTPQGRQKIFESLSRVDEHAEAQTQVTPNRSPKRKKKGKRGKKLIKMGKQRG